MNVPSAAAPPADSKALDAYYAQLANFGALGVAYEQGTRGAFRALLDTCARPVGWTLVEEYALPGSRKRPDGTLLDTFQIPRGYWEAKDTSDDLDAEIAKKIALKYDLSNTIFEDTRRAVLYQNRQRVLDIDLTKRAELSGLLARFLSHSPAEVEEYHKAAAVFADKIPTLAQALLSIVERERGDNPAFVAAFAGFHEMCRNALNPEIGAGQIEEMLVQHLLTERLFRTVFGESEFASRNVIAAEIEKVIAALTSQSFSRADFLKQLDYFYAAIEGAARTITDFSEKQGFLNNVYERFFQEFNKKTADTHGIVYTPQPIVDFMCESVEHVLKAQFGKTLSAPGVTILDPCTGTGNFLVNILRRIGPLERAHKYAHELFANEVMLLPYYVASLNMEHAYFDLQGRYAPFPGLCFADTLDLAKGQQMTLAFTEKNTERVQREQDAAITVIIGNPPYNVGQANENDNNKNRKYEQLDGRIKETYVKDSQATLHTKTYDAYVRFFRWATDRLNGQDGIVCFVTNNGYLHGVAFDGFRKHLAADFTQLYILDLGGNARRGGGGNVFGIRVGVSIIVAVRKAGAEQFVKYCAVPNELEGRDKLAYLKDKASLASVEWETLAPNARHHWLNEGMEDDFDAFLLMGAKDTKASKNIDVRAIFKTYSLGVATNRDEWVYDFSDTHLAEKMQRFSENYNAEVTRWMVSGLPEDAVNEFVNSEMGFLKWTDRLKEVLIKHEMLTFQPAQIRKSLYRPFCKKYLYFDHLLNQRRYQQHHLFPNAAVDNQAIVVGGYGRKDFSVLAVDSVPDLNFYADPAQCFPLYTYALDGQIRRDNITDWALAQFQAAYGEHVTKPDIFHYVYALLHAPDYRARYAENLKRDLPRIPLVGKEALTPPSEGRPSPASQARVGDKSLLPSPVTTGEGGARLCDAPGEGLPGAAFEAFADAGRALAALHTGYEQGDEYPLTQLVNKDVPFSWRVTRMKLSKDRTAVIVNDSLTLAGIPPEAFDYKLGNRSALEWVLDQYQVTTDKRSGLTQDPNREGDPEYIAQLVRRVVTVSVQTVRIVNALPPVVPADAVIL